MSGARATTDDLRAIAKHPLELTGPRQLFERAIPEKPSTLRRLLVEAEMPPKHEPCDQQIRARLHLRGQERIFVSKRVRAGTSPRRADMRYDAFQHRPSVGSSPSNELENRGSVREKDYPNKNGDVLSAPTRTGT